MKVSRFSPQTLYFLFSSFVVLLEAIGIGLIPVIFSGLMDQSLILNKWDRFWMISSGEVDVFFTDVDKNGAYVSALKYLYSAKSGELIFSLLTKDVKNEGFRLLIISKGASIIAINKNKLLDIEHVYLKSMINRWIIKTSARIQSTIAPRIYTPIENAKMLTIKKVSKKL